MIRQWPVSLYTQMYIKTEKGNHKNALCVRTFQSPSSATVRQWSSWWQWGWFRQSLFFWGSVRFRTRIQWMAQSTRTFRRWWWTPSRLAPAPVQTEKRKKKCVITSAVCREVYGAQVVISFVNSKKIQWLAGIWLYGITYSLFYDVYHTFYNWK